MVFFRYNDQLKSANTHYFWKGVVGGLGQSVFWFFLYTSFAVSFWYGIYLMRNDEPGFEPGETLTVSLIVIIC